MASAQRSSSCAGRIWLVQSRSPPVPRQPTPTATVSPSATILALAEGDMKRLILAALLCLSFNLTGHAADSKSPTTAPAHVREVQAYGSILHKAAGARIHGLG